MEIGNWEFHSDRELFVCCENTSDDVEFSRLVNVLQISYIESYEAVILVSKDNTSRVLTKGIKHKGVLCYIRGYCPFSKPVKTSTE